MNKQIFIDVKSKLETDLSGVVFKVDLYNNQFEHEPEERPFKYPAVFIEFSSIEYFDGTSGVQKCELEMTLHCGFHSLVDTISFLDTIQLIAQSIHKFGGDYFAPFIRISENMDVNHDNVTVWQIVFRTSLTDENSIVTRDQILTTIDTLELTRDIDIDNIVIRSGDGNF
jgi:hypothetical protein